MHNHASLFHDCFIQKYQYRHLVKLNRNSCRSGRIPLESFSFHRNSHVPLKMAIHKEAKKAADAKQSGIRMVLMGPPGAGKGSGKL